jgi:hypothetical protein
VPLFLIFTSAPGITAPDESATVPDSEVKKLPCAYARELAAATISRARTPLPSERPLIDSPFRRCPLNSARFGEIAP